VYRQQADIVLIAINLYVFHYFLRDYHYLFNPTFSGRQLGHKTRDEVYTAIRNSGLKLFCVCTYVPALIIV
jgi:hypothetical protein